MAVRTFALDSGGVPRLFPSAAPSALFTATQTAVTDALAVPGLSGVAGATAAVTAIGTAVDAAVVALTAKQVTVLVSGALTKVAIFDALDAIKAHINSNSEYA